jgi:hypothetical protein
VVAQSCHSTSDLAPMAFLTAGSWNEHESQRMIIER